MSVVEPGSSSSNLIERVKNILLRPDATWDEIDAEPATISSIYKGYVIPLAAIPAVSGLIGGVVVGTGALGVNLKTPLIAGIVGAIVSYVLGLAMVYVMALIIDALAPNFGGERDKTKAFKVAAYSSTPSWVAGILLLIPMLGVLAVLAGLYGLFLLYKGLPKLMKAPEEKALPYTVVIIIVAVVLTLVVGAIVGVAGGLGGAAMFANNGPAAGTVTIPGGKASVDLGKLEAASKKMEAAANQMQGGEGPTPADPELLKSFLPGDIAGYARTATSSASGGAGGVTGSTAEATYAKGDAQFRLSITDLGAAGALAGLAGAFNVNSSSESDGKSEKISNRNGRMTTESYDKNSGHGEYGVLVGERFMVQAEGDGVDMGALKSAVDAVQPSRLEGLAKS